MYKKIIFFDGDGTLWYPKLTKHTVKPHWLYQDKNIKDYHTHLVIIPEVKNTLRKLNELGIKTIILSTHPHEEKEAYSILTKKVEYFKLDKLFTEVHATREYYRSKGEYILRILKKMKIPKTKALMIGDNYLWDYKPAKEVGIEALLVESDYMKKDKRIKVLKKFSDILKCI